MQTVIYKRHVRNNRRNIYSKTETWSRADVAAGALIWVSLALVDIQGNIQRCLRFFYPKELPQIFCQFEPRRITMYVQPKLSHLHPSNLSTAVKEEFRRRILCLQFLLIQGLFGFVFLKMYKKLEKNLLTKHLCNILEELYGVRNTHIYDFSRRIWLNPVTSSVWDPGYMSA